MLSMLRKLINFKINHGRTTLHFLRLRPIHLDKKTLKSLTLKMYYEFMCTQHP